MRRLLASLSFPLLIAGGFLVWQGYRELMRGGIGWRSLLFLVVGGMCFALGLAGVRERHRPGD